ncbi:MAG TPA: DUF5615 family PIN-like protein [Phenylobacterium sp.]
MKFIIDAQLPPGLADWIERRGHEAQHVYRISRVDAPDALIWELALEQGAIVVTKDHDFVEWATKRHPAPPIVWVRLGNAANAPLTARVEAVWDQIVADLESGAQVVEVGRE